MSKRFGRNQKRKLRWELGLALLRADAGAYLLNSVKAELTRNTTGRASQMLRDEIAPLQRLSLEEHKRAVALAKGAPRPFPIDSR